MGLIALAVVAGVAALAYRMGYNRSRTELASLKEEMEQMEAAEKDAAIVKRVSQQMEDIAYQQKAISDQQRDRAEEQSILATQNAYRAEMESRAAHEAELKAQSAAQVAERERANAERQQEIAVEQRDEATHAKNVADTLNRRTQARSLAVSSQVRREAGEPEVADLLAYASWYFLKNNRGNQYYSETFKSLTQATDGILRYKMKEGGAVNALAKVPGRPGQCVAVSNFGEVERLTVNASQGGKRISSNALLFNSLFDFRDVLIKDNSIYALSLKGPLCVLDFEGNHVEVQLPEDNYFKLVPIGDGLLVAGRKSLSWYSDGKITGSEELPGTLSAIVEREGVTCLFFTDGGYAEMDVAGRIVEKAPLLKGVVTAAYYDKASKCLLLGVEDGTVYPVNQYDRVMETMAAHKAKCMDITMLGPVVVTGGYDKTAYIWNMDNLLFESGLSFREELQKEKVEKRVSGSQEVPTEWLVPVDYTFDGWTLAVCGDEDGKSVWIGTSSGNVMLLNASADDMAQQLHNKLKRNLTQQEWTRYVGVSIPYMTFK
ncbi:MAG: hypothetical protein IJQ96_01080 [Bacteroidales bacterium]|nr:hypothetical protein [Bacteroidales bacterium]